MCQGPAREKRAAGREGRRAAGPLSGAANARGRAGSPIAGGVKGRAGEGVMMNWQRRENRERMRGELFARPCGVSYVSPGVNRDPWQLMGRNHACNSQGSEARGGENTERLQRSDVGGICRAVRVDHADIDGGFASIRDGLANEDLLAFGGSHSELSDRPGEGGHSHTGSSTHRKQGCAAVGKPSVNQQPSR
jgi:hypothetical protein